MGKARAKLDVKRALVESEEVRAVSAIFRIYDPDPQGVVEVLFTIPPDPRPRAKPQAQTALIYPTGYVTVSDGW